MDNIPVLTVYDEDGNEIPIPALKGRDGEDYVLTEADKREIANMIAPNKETWAFTLEDGTTVTKEVHIG